MKFAHEEQMLSPKKLAKRWDVSGRTVARRVERGELVCLKIGKSIRFRVEDVLRFEENATIDKP